MPDLKLERKFLKQGYGLIAGIDEAGRGAWAGPVVAAAVILPLARPDLPKVLRGVDDSKKLTARRRETLFEVIRTAAVSVGVGQATAAEIDQLGIVPATQLAMQRAVAGLQPAPAALLIDAVKLTAHCALPQHSLYYGDSLSLSIAAASIIAKVTRDRQMPALDEQYPGYAFARHKGYGTAGHQAALNRLGVSAVHRRSYRPVQVVLQRDPIKRG